MRKIMGLFLAVCIFTGFDCLLISEELLELEIVKQPTFKEVGGFWYIYMDVTCPRAKMREMTKISVEEFQKQGLKSDWTFLIFHNWPDTAEGIVKWERGIIVPENTKCAPPLRIAKLEKFKALTYAITGSFALKDIAKGNHLVEAHIKEKGYKHIWPIYEVARAKPMQFHYWYLVEE